MSQTINQLGFDHLLNDADKANDARQFERETTHLPATMAEALPFYRALLSAHDSAMTGGDIEEAVRLREEANRLARRLNHGAPGILADADMPGCVLEHETAARQNGVPLWGQCGDFIVTVGTMKVRIEMDGIFGIGTRYSIWPGFAAHAVDKDKPFLSETGYRSFLGVHATYRPGLTPETFAIAIIAAYVDKELKGRLVSIEQAFRAGAA